MVLYGVISPPLEIFSNLSPSVSQASMRQEEHPLLMLTPLLFLDVRIKMVVPSLPALLANAPFIIQKVPGRFSAIVVHF
jgi:hypothetical protein